MYKRIAWDYRTTICSTGPGLTILLPVNVPTRDVYIIVSLSGGRHLVINRGHEVASAWSLKQAKRKARAIING